MSGVGILNNRSNLRPELEALTGLNIEVDVLLDFVHLCIPDTHSEDAYHGPFYRHF